MKISNIVIAVSAIIVLGIMISLVGISVTPFAFLLFGIPLALFAYLIILAKRYVDVKASESEISMDLHVKIVLLNESMDRIEKKVEKIESILEKVSD